jgi:hypothetical protein
MFYSNVTALAIFNYLRECSGGLHALDMVLLTIQMSKYYEGTPDIPGYIFLLEDAQCKVARACLIVIDQTLTVLASTALLAADTFPHTTELWEELDSCRQDLGCLEDSLPCCPQEEGQPRSCHWRG